MSKIRIKKFGPIKEGLLENDGWLDIKKVTVFTGNQGSGKSTVAKLISMLTWLEKSINRGDILSDKLNFNEFNYFCQYHRIHNYFTDDTEIDYIGDKIKLNYNGKVQPYPEVELLENSKYLVPKIMYIPAERNFLSVISSAYDVKNLPGSLFTFAEELKRVYNLLGHNKVKLPVGGVSVQYNIGTGVTSISNDTFILDLNEASSGYQSLIPVYLVSMQLTDELKNEKKVLRQFLGVNQSMQRNEKIARIMLDEHISNEQKTLMVNELDAKYISTCLFNIVEEPEQNLFPSSQKSLLFSLLEFNNILPGNRLVMTTHSPYLINYITLAVKAEKVFNDLIENKARLKDPEMEQLNEIVPFSSFINSNDLAIYELDEAEGTISKLSDYKGLPSDENYLNKGIEDSNELFAQLQEIEKGWR